MMKYIKVTVLVLLLTLTFFSCSDGENGIDGIDGIDGVDGMDGSNPQGLEFLILAGDITPEEATQIIAENFGTNTHTLLVLGTTNLITLDLPDITSLNEIEIEANEKLQSITMPNLEMVTNLINIRDNPSLSSIDFEKLSIVESISCRNNAVLNSVSFESLTQVFNTISIRENPALPTLIFPELKTAANFSLRDLDNLSTFDAPVLETMENLSIESDMEFSMDISSIQNFNSIRIDPNGQLSTISIDNLLTGLVNISPAITGKTIALRGDPSVQAEIDAQTLRDQGNIVSFDNE